MPQKTNIEWTATYLSDGTIRKDDFQIIPGDAFSVLKTLESESVQCCITSPPYLGLRDYSTSPIVWGGDPECEHDWQTEITPRPNQSGGSSVNKGEKIHAAQNTVAYLNRAISSQFCSQCGAWLGSLGLEPTVQLYIQNLVTIFEEVRRVLKKDGTFWLNLGDSYAGGKGQSGSQGAEHQEKRNKNQRSLNKGYQTLGGKKETKPTDDRTMLRAMGLKPKDLIGIPWRVAFALQEAGWYLRQDIIWAKPNPMPESVRDRCTKSHEYVFMLTKGQASVRTIKVSNLSPDFFHFDKNLGLQNCGMGGVTLFCVRLASSILDFAEREQQIGLPPFYSEKWQQQTNCITSPFISNLPEKYRPLCQQAAWFLRGDISTKSFLEQIYSFGLDLPNRNQLLIGGVPALIFNSPTIYVKGDASIAINDAGKVCEFDFLHNTIVLHSPTTCKYYFDQDAIREPLKDSSVARLMRGVSENHKAVDGYPSQTPHTISQPGDNIHRSSNGNRNGEGASTLSHKNVKPKGQTPHSMHLSRLTGASDAEYTIESAKKKAARPHGIVRDRLLDYDSKESHLRPNTKRGGYESEHDLPEPKLTANKRSVWTVATQPFKESHFAVMPEKLVEPMILAGSRPGDLVLDPFSGAGTVGLVSLKHKRRFLGIELNGSYVEISQRRLKEVQVRLFS